jgi:WD40 repeat protein
VGRTDGDVTLFDTQTHTIGATLKRDRDQQGMVPRVEELAVSPDASRLAVVSNEYIGLWNLADNSRVWRSEGGRLVERTQPRKRHAWSMEGPVGRAIAFAPDGRTFATGADDGIVWWRDYDGTAFREFRWDVGEIHALAFSPDGLTCAAAGLKGKVVVWDVDS